MKRKNRPNDKEVGSRFEHRFPTSARSDKLLWFYLVGVVGVGAGAGRVL